MILAEVPYSQVEETTDKSWRISLVARACMWLGVLSGAKPPREDATMWRLRVDIVTNVPKCLVPMSIFYRYR